MPSVEPDPKKTLEKARADLGALLERVRSSPDIDTYLSAIRTANVNRTIHFDNLWTIFPPGELVYATPFMKESQIFIVKECSILPIDMSESGRTNKDTRKVWDLHCWSYDWDGKHFTRVPVMFRFEEFAGAKVIDTLKCHPLRFKFPEGDPNSERETLEKRLIERGRLFRSFCARTTGEQMIYYEGETISHGSGFQRLRNKPKQASSDDDFYMAFFGRRRRKEAPPKASERRQYQITGPVMVDFSSYLQHAPNMGAQAPMGDIMSSYKDDECNCGSCTSNIPLRENQRRHFDMYELDREFTSDEQYLLCPPRVLGYHLHTRTWLELNIRHFITKEIQNDDAFKRLQLDGRQKDLIKKLVQSHTSSTQKAPMMEDIVRGKGKGLVMLLHGPPGVGKTLTAESVASLTGKPLFAVSPSDIGLDATDVEHNLESLFELAANWRAVLLFDEADVFLESRSSHNSDLQRNATVSVLLRVLEYYQGILILTTNRIKQFDIAVLSRVNLGIKYEPLEHRDKLAIFKDFLMRVENRHDIERREKIIEWFEEDSDAKEWFKPLNGRQVRNVLFSAACLGSSGGDKLTLEHIKTMAKCTFKFQDSLLFEMEKWTKQNEAGRHDHY
ncbi:P-loop containing nucleoside triphosphate hydrolase protein [Paraphaeosphaeria sporulosa]|uniref:p-loop containing nucleoside triphosphate hydrolase protein n=1 Tax=Paraphaeosphaeria sporulosa TaxID=1460663 RepID=A0A177C6H7_9PLEO|nr:P-loop containing nucleoside triphosphate hydrolase protein [Paraphaeosphaeria sporulosa]OAG03006.1 P-loop containing nucleoside triphosphate hydrolase protein [Paraphaeosphaeria sporulosa]